MWHPVEMPDERRQVGALSQQREALESRTHRHQAVQLNLEVAIMLDREPAQIWAASQQNMFVTFDFI